MNRPATTLRILGLFLLAFALAAPIAAAPVGTAFTYQGRLMDEGLPASGLYDLQFSLFDVAAGGAPLGSTVSVPGVNVDDGRFTTALDFGTAAFGGGARWLEISLRPAGGGGYTLLAPRQALTPAPYALGMPNVYTNEAQGFVGIGRSNRLTGAEVFGLRANTTANVYGGMYVETSDPAGWPFYGYATDGAYQGWTYYTTEDIDTNTPAGWHVYAGGNRLTVAESGGLRIGDVTSGDGIVIGSTTDDGLQVGQAGVFPHYGMYIPPPGVSYYGLWPNTANALGQWALYSTDNISAGNVFASKQTLIARVTGATALRPGDLVAAAGLTDPVPGGTERLVQVRLAGGEAVGIVGVVASRMVNDLAPGKEDEGARALHSVEGPARSGDYVALVVLGVADVKLAAGASIARGARLTAASADGAARPLRTEILNGMTVSEGAQVVGIALEAASPGADTVPVFVTLH